jgi:sugar lactone lactonase YvrE
MRSKGKQLFLLGLAIMAAAPVVAQSDYKVVARWKIGGEGGWDYLASDSAAHRLYVTHGPRVEVLDSESGKVVGAITGLKGTHGVALDQEGRYGYISDGGANAVVVFDRQSLARTNSIPAGANPDGILFEPATHTVWAFNGRSQNVTVIDSRQQKAIATVALPGKPEFPVADGTGTIFVNIEDRNEIDRLDARTRRVTARWPLAACESPSGLAIDLAGHRLFAVCDGKKMAVVDAGSGKVLATTAIGEEPDAARYDGKRKLAFASNGDGTLTVVDAAHSGYPVLQTVATQRGARTMTLDEQTGRIFLSTAEFGPRPAGAPNAHTRPSVVPGSFTILVVASR